MTQVIGNEERRARLAARHLLLPHLRTDDLASVTDAVVALHSSDPVTVFLSAGLRMASPSLAAVERVLYDERSLIRHHAMRRTLWVATPAVARDMHAAATRALVGPEQRRTGGYLRASGVQDPDAWLEDAYHQVLDDLREHGPSTARELGQRIEALRLPLQVGGGTPYAATQAAHTRVLFLLGVRGELVRARPTGSWVNGAYRYAATDRWLAGGLGDADTTAAAARLAARYLERFGPATSTDLQWWAGWTKTMTTRALADCGAVPVEVEDGPAWLARDDPGPGETAPWTAVLPSLDPTTMGWKQRSWYLPDQAADAFDRNGNAGATLWVDGRVVGAWAQHRDGRLLTHYFEPVPADRQEELADRLAVLAELVGETRFTVRFPGRIQARILS